MDKKKSKKSTLRKKKTEENKFKLWMNNKFIPAMGKVGNQRYLASIRDAFGTMLPIIIAGSLGVLINAIIFGGAGSGYVSLMGLFGKASHPELSWENVGNMINGKFAVAAMYPGWHQASQIAGLAFGHISTVTIGMMSIWFSFLFGYYIALSRGFKAPIIAGMISTVSFLLASLGEVAFFMDAKGLIAAIIFGIGATELFIWLSNVRALNINLPEGVPPAVGKSFQVFLPAFITLATVGALNIVVLAPAIVTGNLAVTSSQSFIFSPADKEVANHWSTMFKNPDVTAGITGLIGTAQFAPYADLLNDLSNHFANLSQDEFVTWYNGLDTTQAAVVATAISNLHGTALGSIWNINSNALLNFVSDNQGSYVVTVRWRGMVLAPSQFGISAAIYQFVTSWFISFATGQGGLGIALLYVFLVGFFWFFGIHGSNIVGGIFEPIFLMILGVNLALVTSMGYDMAAASGEMGVFARSFFDAYMYVGGSGGTLGMIVALLFFSKRRELKEISKFALPAGVFQINEPMIFGIPIVLNPVYAVPFIFTPMFSLIIGWVFSPAVLGFVHYSYIAVPWTAPWFLGAVLTSLDINALLPAAIVGAFTIVMYTPFVLLDNYLHFKKLKKTNFDLFETTMRYFNDPKYKFITDTQAKYEAMLNKTEVTENIAAESIEHWTNKLSGKDDKRLNEKINAIQAKMNSRVEVLTQKAVAYKNKREALIPSHEQHWEEVRQRKMAKFEQRYNRNDQKLVK